jgi:hypothetical protein
MRPVQDADQGANHEVANHGGAKFWSNRSADRYAFGYSDRDAWLSCADFVSDYRVTYSRARIIANKSAH